MATDKTRVTAYVSPGNGELLSEFRKQGNLSESKAVDIILTEFFRGGIPQLPSNAPSNALGRASSASRNDELLEKVAALEARLNEISNAPSNAPNDGLLEKVAALEEKLNTLSSVPSITPSDINQLVEDAIARQMADTLGELAA